MPETIHCPQCSRELRVPETLLGKRVKCPGCGTTFTAPAPAPDAAGEGYEAVPEPEPGRAAGAPGPAEAPPPPPGTRPKEVDWIAHMALFGGIWAVVLPTFCCLTNVGIWAWQQSFHFGVACCLFPEIYSIVIGILSILLGLKLRRPDAYLQPPPLVNAILRIVNIVMLDIPNVAMGAYTLYLLRSNPAVQAYFKGGRTGATSEPPPAV